MKSIFLLLAFALSGCAYEGVIVRKELNPNEAPVSLGIVASPKFELRDSAGNHYSQLVSLEVFQHYQVGDYFNDAQMAARFVQTDDKLVKPIQAVPEPVTPIVLQPRVAHAAKRHHRRTAVAAKHRRHRASQTASVRRKTRAEG